MAVALGAWAAAAQTSLYPIEKTMNGANDFIGCDGYGAPTPEGDGMIHFAMTLGIFNTPGEGNTMRQTALTGPAGVAACDQAIPAVPPQHWRRVVSLLLARAVHDLEARDAKAALADLDKAEAAARDPADAFYARSLGLDLDSMRAYALRQTGEAAAARALALKTLDARPWRKRAPQAAVVVLSSSADEDTLASLLRRGAALDPRGLDGLFNFDLAKGRFAEAALIHPSLVMPLLPEPTGYPAQVEQEKRVIGALYWMNRDSQYAYALAALGRADEARAAIADARQRFEAQTQNPVDPLPPKVAARRMMEINDNNRARAIGEPSLTRYDALVKARLLAADGHPEEALQTIAPLSKDVLWLDVAKAASPSPNRTNPPPPVIVVPTGVDKLVTAFWKNDLPEAEARERLPSETRAGAAIAAAWSGASPHPVRDGPAPEPGAVSIKTHPQRGPTMDMVGEMVLLRAAELAHEQNKKGMVVLRREEINHILNTFVYGRQVRSDPTGFESDMDVLFVDPGALPAAYAATPWRVLDVDAILASLTPVYRRPAA
ncbi:MAG TPA: hypothetical protein VG248_01040 [Caulobacteraceae bacterium]|jgi:hypothetical protein|nr:hypothetical protein [Caulobacteraceae bacterium]